MTLNGNATYNAASDIFSLIQDAQLQRGALCRMQRIDLRSDFDLSFDIYFGNKDAAGADGMAFVFHNDPFGADATGNWRRFFGASGIRNGVAIEFDTYQNAALGDIANDHTNFFDTDGPGPGSTSAAGRSRQHRGRQVAQASRCHGTLL